MKRLAMLALLALLPMGCLHGPCCSDGDCLGNAICSADCARGGGQGECLPRCQVDRDCGAGSSCDAFPEGCACVASDGGPGTCPRGQG